MNKKYINHATVASYLSLVVEKMHNDGFIPDLVVGISRGGLVPGIMLSHLLKKPFVPIEASLREIIQLGMHTVSDLTKYQKFVSLMIFVIQEQLLKH